MMVLKKDTGLLRRPHRTLALQRTALLDNHLRLTAAIHIRPGVDWIMQDIADEGLRG